jgi:hypothetical protein
MPTLASTPPPTPALPAPAPQPSPTPPVVTGVANGSNTGTKVALQTSYLALIAGLEANYQPGDVFELPMGDMTRDELIAHFEGFVTAAEATKASNQAWRQDVQDERAAEQSARPYRAAVKAVLLAKLGKSSPKLTTYGFPPAKVGVKSTATKSAAVAKAEATRVARGTKGSVQKQSIVGNVTGVIITPVTAGPPVPVPVTGASASNAASGTAKA